MSEWKDFLNEQLKDPEVRTEWNTLEPEFATAQAIINARKITRLTQPLTINRHCSSQYQQT